MTNNKISSYQNLKNKYNERLGVLYEDIKILVESDDENLVNKIKVKWYFKFEKESILMFGTPTIMKK